MKSASSKLFASHLCACAQESTICEHNKYKARLTRHVGIALSKDLRNVHETRTYVRTVTNNRVDLSFFSDALFLSALSI